MFAFRSQPMTSKFKSCSSFRAVLQRHFPNASSGSISTTSSSAMPMNDSDNNCRNISWVGQKSFFHSPAYKRHLRRKQVNHEKEHKDSKAQLSSKASTFVSSDGDSISIDEKYMNNDTLVTLGSLGNLEARQEILRRHIMCVDKVTYEEADEKFKQIKIVNTKSKHIFSLPYVAGVTLAVGGAAASFPLVFSYDAVAWFNAAYVTADVPEPKDLETWLEVGSWAWNWMEPVMGQISFVLLCLQYSRSQLDNLGRKPYTKLLKQYRAERLAKAYPTYCKRILMSYSQACPLF